MSITYKTNEEIATLREGGKRLADILHALVGAVQPGVSTEALNKKAVTLFEQSGGTPAFYEYAPAGVSYGFPAHVCVSINEVIVHGIPNVEPKIITEGDLVTVDAGLTYEGLITDSAVTCIAGEPRSQGHVALLKATRRSLYEGMKVVKPGNHIGDIGAVIGAVAEKEGYGNAEGLAGHGVGYTVHEDPYVPNTGTQGDGVELKPGMVLAIEPMFTLGSSKISVSDDEFTISTADGSLSAHFEHTVAVTEDGCTVLTERVG